MKILLFAQLDYFYFIYGLAFFLLFLVCNSLKKYDSSNIPWIFLGLFGFIHGINEWLDLSAFSVGDNLISQWGRMAIISLSFLCLFEFGRLTSERFKFIRIGRWVYIPLFLLIFAGAHSTENRLEAFLRLSLGLTGGLWSAYALWRIFKGSRDAGRGMIIVAGALALYALSIGFQIKYDPYLDRIGLPVQFLQGLAVCIITGMIWRYYVYCFAEKISRPVALVEKKLAFAVVVSLILILTLGWFWTEQLSRSESAEQQERLLRYSQQIAGTLNLDLIQTLSGTPSDINNSEYQILENSLQQMRDTMSSVGFIYIIRKVGAKNIVLVDSEPFGSKFGALPGDEFKESDQYSNLSSKWNTIYTPLVDERNGNLVAVLCVKQYRQYLDYSVAIERIKGIGIVGVFCLGILLIYVYWQRFSIVLGQKKSGEKMGLVVHWGIAAIVVLIGISLTIFLFMKLREDAWDLFQTTFTQRAMIRVQNISQEMDRQLDRLNGLCRFMGSNEYVDRNAFNEYVAPFFKDIPVHAFVWVPRVSWEDRLFYESSAKQDGLDGYQIFEKDRRGQKVPALKRDEYFPVYYVQPWKGNEEASGFDMASEPVRNETLKRSRDLGEPVTTPPLILMEAGKERLGYIIFMPVYAKDLPRHTIFQRRKSLRGFVMAVFNTQEFLKGVYSNMPAEGLSCLVQDLSAPRDRQVLYRHKPQIGVVDWAHPLLKYETLLDIPDRQWYVTIVSGSMFIEKNLSKMYWWALLVGAVLTVLLAAFLNFLALARYRAENLVKLRTEELNKEKESLRKKEEDFLLILDSTAEAIYGIDLTGNCTFCNPSCIRLLGYENDQDLLGKNMHGLIHYKYPDGTPFPVDKCQLYQAFKNNSKIHLEQVFWRLDGTSFIAEVWSYPELRDGKVVGAVVSFLDITERKRLDDSLNRAKEMAENALAVKDEFTSTVSHELRTPLASIKSSIDILDTEVPGKLTTDQKTFIKRVKTNIDRLARLINDVLDLSKLESGKIALNLMPVRPELLIQEVVESHQSMANSKGLKIVTKCAEDLPILIADRDRLNQVLNNLISNALKFTKEGQIVVSVNVDEKHFMLFCVSDTGIGIKEEDLPKLFQKFQQVGGAHQQVGGTGLGLAICKQIIAKHRGRMWIRSQFGNGSEFYFIIPIRKDKRVLIVDDDEGTLRVIKSILKSENIYDIETAGDGFLAGQKYIDFLPQLIILDINLPKINGLEVCSRIKNDPKSRNTKIIMLSSFSTEIQKQEARKAGADEIINKPIKPQDLIAMVKRLI